MELPLWQRSAYPETAILRLTEQCNLSCLHCSVNASPGKFQSLTHLQTKNIIDQLSNLGVQVIKLTGGEPLNLAWIADVTVQAVNAGIQVELETSATTINTEILEQLDGYQKKIKFAVGLDSLNYETYEYFRNTLGSFNNVMNGLELIRHYQFPIKIMTVLSKLNQHEIIDIVEWTWGNFEGQGFHRLLPVLSSFGRGVNAVNTIGLSTIELYKFLYNTYFPFYRRCVSDNLNPSMNIGLPLALVPFDLNIYPLCGCGIKKIGITPHGSIGLCHLIEGHDFAISGSLNNYTNLKDEWINGTPFQTMRVLARDDIKGICNSCRFFRICLGGCRVHSNARYDRHYYSDPTCQSFADIKLFPEHSLLP